MAAATWRQRTAVAAGLVVAALTLWHLPGQLRGLWADARNGAARTAQERLLAPAEARGIRKRRVFEAAARMIPANERFTVVLGPDAERAEPGARSAATFAAYWLLPRRRVGYDAPWVLYYGFEPPRAPVPARRTLRLADGVSLLRTR